MEITLMEMEHHPGSIHHPVHITLKEKVVALDPMLKETLVVLVEEVGIKTPQVEAPLIKTSTNELTTNRNATNRKTT